jgi:predicted peptidase
MKKITFLIIIQLTSNLYAQDLNLFEDQIFVHQNDTLNYRILKPLDYDPNQQYPVHLFLHGAGERGSDNSSQLMYVDLLFLKKENRELYKSWVILPQCPKDDRWPRLSSDNEWNNNFENKTTRPNKSLELVMKLMDKFIEKTQVNKQKVYVSGLSMGGMGTFEILYRRPNMFAAATPICGNGIAAFAKRYATKVSVWVFHGSDDKVVHPKHSLKMVEAIIASGGSPNMTLYENVGHDSWNNAFAEPNFLKWIHSKSKK